METAHEWALPSLLRGAFLIATLCALCLSSPAQAQTDLHRAVPPSGRALIFVYRVDGDAPAPSVPVAVNRERVGELASGTFVTATVDPGATELRVGQRVVRTLTFTASANQNYFVRIQALDDRTPARVDAHSVSEPDGRHAIARSRHVGIAPVVVIPPFAPPPEVARPAPSPSLHPPVTAPAAVPPSPAPAPAVVAPPVVAPAPIPEPSVTKPATATEVPAPTKSPRESQFALIANAGTFRLSNERQTFAGFPITYDTTSNSVFGAEFEWRSGSGLALGGEYLTYNNDLVTTTPIPNVQQKVHLIMGNAKYYFHAADWFYPFVGIGVGQANASFSGGVTGSVSGLAYQALAGVEFRFKPVGISVQYRHVSADIGDSGREVKVGGKGVLAGISISF